MAILRYLVLIFVLFFALSASAEGGFISLKTTISIIITNRTANVFLSIENLGNEPASSVQPAIYFLNESLYGEVKSLLGPQSKYAANYSFFLGEIKGAYPLIAYVHYIDSNGYKFSSASVNRVIIGKTLVSDVIGKISDINMVDKGVLTVKVKNSDNKDYNVKASIILPQELTSEKTGEIISIKGNEEKGIAFKIHNFSALKGSKYSVFVLLEYDKNSGHVTEILSSAISIVEQRPNNQKFDKVFWILATALMLLLMLFTYSTKDSWKKLIKK